MQEMIYLLQPKIFVYLLHNVAYNHLWYVYRYVDVYSYIFICMYTLHVIHSCIILCIILCKRNI